MCSASSVKILFIWVTHLMNGAQKQRSNDATKVPAPSPVTNISPVHLLQEYKHLKNCKGLL